MPYTRTVSRTRLGAAGDPCDFGLLRYITFQGHQVPICKSRFFDIELLSRARYDYIDKNGLWESMGCMQNGIYAWPVVDGAQYGSRVEIFGAHRDDACTPDVSPPPFNPWGGLSPENWKNVDNPTAAQIAYAQKVGVALVPTSPAGLLPVGGSPGSGNKGSTGSGPAPGAIPPAGGNTTPPGASGYSHSTPVPVAGFNIPVGLLAGAAVLGGVLLFAGGRR